MGIRVLNQRSSLQCSCVGCLIRERKGRVGGRGEGWCQRLNEGSGLQRSSVRCAVIGAGWWWFVVYRFVARWGFKVFKVLLSFLPLGARKRSYIRKHDVPYEQVQEFY